MRRIRKISLSSRGIYEPVLLEEDVLIQCRALLEFNGARVFRVAERIPKRNKYGKIVGRTSERGIPDLFGWFPKSNELKIGDQIVEWSIAAKVFFIEMKKPGEHPTPIQEMWIKAANEDGVICLWADSMAMMCEKFRLYGIELRGK